MEEMEAALLAHEVAERANDLDGVLATLTAHPVYEFPSVGWKVEGQEGVIEFYRRTIPRMMARNIQATKRLHALGQNALFREAYVTIDADGETATCNYCAVIVVDDDENLIASERLYTDPYFAKVLAADLGDDFGDVPGVSRMDWVR
jgi:hypothetical protein